MNDRPEPGSPEYDEMMAEKFRQQRDGSSTPPSHQSDLRQSGALSIRISSTIGPPNAKEYYGEDAADATKITAIENEIARVRGELEAQNGFDQRTGEPKLMFVGNDRRIRELHLAQLERELPYIREIVRLAQEWRAANVPTTEEKLASEAQHQAEIRKRAQEIADEREAQAQADRVMEQRRSERGG